MSTGATTRNPLLELLDQGQSVWYDYIRRGLIDSGELARLIAEDGLRGITSNPSIWEKAIAGSTDYDEAIEALRREGEADPKAVYEQLAIQDIQDAADAFRPAYEQTDRRDGLVSIEVSPDLAHDTEGTIAEAERLWKAIGRDNVMVKVPATDEGIPAIRELIGRGINVNITLLFAIPVYEQVVDAYMSGLETLAASGGDLARIASVASFFVSRIDTIADAKLDEVADGPPRTRPRASCRARSRSRTRSSPTSATRTASPRDRWKALAAQGAGVQRLLWASTSTKNPKYPELMYVEELIGPDTVDTVPPATFDAFRRHGRPRASLEEDVAGARDTLAALDELGISLDGDHRPADRGRRGPLRPGLPEAVRGDQRRAGATGRGRTFAAREPAAGDRDRGSRHDRRLAVRGEGAAPVVGRQRLVDERGRVGLARLAPCRRGAGSRTRSGWTALPAMSSTKASTTCSCSAWVARASARSCSR